MLVPQTSAYLPTLLVFPGFSKCLKKSPGFLVRAPNLLGNTYRGLSQNYSLNFIIFKMSKRKINGKWIWCTSIGKIKTEQSSWHTIYLMSDCRNWSEINQSDWTIHGRKLAWFLRAVLVVVTSGTFGRPSGDFWRLFRHCRKWHSYNAKISRCLQVSVPWGLAGMRQENQQWPCKIWAVFLSHNIGTNFQ